MADSSLLILSLIITSGEHPIMNLEKIFVQEGLEFSEVLGKKMIDTETELEKIGHNNKFVSNSMSSLEVRKVRPNEYMFIKVRSSQVRNSTNFDNRNSKKPKTFLFLNRSKSKDLNSYNFWLFFKQSSN